MTDSHSPSIKCTFMVVDDDPEMVAMVRNILEEKEYNVRCAYSGPQFFAALEEQKPDVIVLDVMMPEMDGFEVLKRLKCERKTSSIPVILVAGQDEYENKITGYKMGVDYFITKPFTRGQLVDSINSILSWDIGLRHSFGSRLAMAGVDLKTINEFMRHNRDSG